MDTTVIREVATAVFLLILCIGLSVKLIRDGDDMTFKRKATIVIAMAIVFILCAVLFLPAETVNGIQTTIDGLLA